MRVRRQPADAPHLRRQHRRRRGRAGARWSELATELGSLTWDYCVADQASSAAHKGFVTSLIEPEHLYGGDVAVYLCGPPPMVEGVRKHLDDAGVEPAGFYYERFALSGTGAAAAAPRCPPSPRYPP